MKSRTREVKAVPEAPQLEYENDTGKVDTSTNESYKATLPHTSIDDSYETTLPPIPTTSRGGGPEEDKMYETVFYD